MPVARCSFLIAHVCMRASEGYSKPWVSAWQGHRGSHEGRGEGEREEEGTRGEGVWGVRARGQFVARIQSPVRESTPGVDTASWV